MNDEEACHVRPLTVSSASSSWDSTYADRCCAEAEKLSVVGSKFSV